MFGDPVTNPMGWKVKPLRECANFFNGKAHEQIIDMSGKYVLVTSRCIASDGIDFRRTSEQLFPLVIGDIVMVMSDVPNGKALARCMLIDRNDYYSLNQRICCLRDYKFNSLFFFHLLNRHGYFLLFNNGDSQTNLRKDDLLNCPIIIPPLSLQARFADFVKQVDKTKFVLQQGLEKLELTYKALMQQYFCQ